MQGGTEECSPLMSLALLLALREMRLQPCAARTENKGMPPHSCGEAGAEPHGCMGRRVVAAPQGSPATLPPHPTFGRDDKASRQLPALGCPGYHIRIPHWDGFAVSELVRTNYSSVASCFSTYFVLYLLFPSIRAGENLVFSLFQMC